jgi:uncharacterized protein (DUF934 family)
MPKLIKNDAVIEDDWSTLAEGATRADIPAWGPVLVPLALWKAERDVLLARGNVGVVLQPADEPAELAADVTQLQVIAIAFPKFGDGRGFSSARLLRDRHGYKGELRAIGDVFRDQFFFMRECGFDAFAVRPDLDAEAELAGFRVFDRTYTHSVRHEQPSFRERGGHA